MTHPDRAIEAGARARVVAAAQQAIMKNGFHDGSPVSAFGFANSAYGAILTALAAEGLVVVPKEPTEAMRSAVAKFDWESKCDVDWADGYRVMLAAAQEQNDARPSPEADR